MSSSRAVGPTFPDREISHLLLEICAFDQRIDLVRWFVLAAVHVSLAKPQMTAAEIAEFSRIWY